MNNDVTFNLILEVITNFYTKATSDILIGYHFRHIDNFDTHLPRIASFWQLQLTGKIDDKGQLPFHLIQVHIPLKVNLGEIDRWAKLFEQTLIEFVKSKKISEEFKNSWMEKVNHFKEKLKSGLGF